MILTREYPVMIRPIIIDDEDFYGMTTAAQLMSNLSTKKRSSKKRKSSLWISNAITDRRRGREIETS